MCSLQVVFGIYFGSLYLAQSIPFIETFAQAKTAAALLYTIIDRVSNLYLTLNNKNLMLTSTFIHIKVPSIDSSSGDGIWPTEMTGNVTFHSVNFNYPSRPSIEVKK